MAWIESQDRFTPAGRGRHAAALLAVILLIGLPIRLYLAARAAMLSRDGGLFIFYAQGLAVDPLAELRRQAQHVLYPALVLAAHGLQQRLPGAPADPVRSWETAAVTVTLIGGLAVIAAVYALARALFSPRIGLIAALLAAGAAELCQLSADALTDMPHLAVYLLAMAAAAKGLKAGSHAWLAAGGLLSGIAYLVRPEGAEVALAATAILVIGARGEGGLHRRLTGIAAILLGAALAACPYMLLTGKLVAKKPIWRLLPGTAGLRPPALDRETARWQQASSATASILYECAQFRDTSHSERPRGLKPAAPGWYGIAHGHIGSTGPQRSSERRTARAEARGSSPPRKVVCLASARAGLIDVFAAVAKIVENYGRSLRVTFMIPAAVWLARRRKMPGDARGCRLVASAGALHVLILVLLLLRFDYWDVFSLRHVLVLTGLTLPFSAAGVPVILAGVAPGWRRGAAVVMGVLMVTPTLPWMLETRNAGMDYLRQAGQYIRREGEDQPRVMVVWEVVTFYAHGQHVPLPQDGGPDRVLAEARAAKPHWLVLDERRSQKLSPVFFDDLERAARPGELSGRVRIPGDQEWRGDRAIVYRYRPAP